ncbi:MAG: MFS transporter [Capsulimonas sp.]|uniref:MFS transporter n=1 Tax=Capsulimonas sp. TaxID=2494211 RepID=UPI003266D471
MIDAAKLDRQALINALIGAMLSIASIYFGSGRMNHFDPALIAYTSACVFATFGIVYRYSIWLQKPPTQMYWRRGWALFLRPKSLPGNLAHLAKLIWNNMVAQTFIERRNHVRWMAHFLMSWGCLVACAVTFPLVFGWIHFDADPALPTSYQAFVFGVHAGTFPSASIVGWVIFHILDFCAVAVIVGMILAMRRRMSDPGAMTVQQFSMDFLPLILLFMVCITGIMLTVSSMWLKGYSYSVIAVLHAFSVIMTLLYLPFGKFFHIFQRPANLGVQYYKEEGASTEQAHCLRCDEPYASRMQVEDLKVVLDKLGVDQHFSDGSHYQDVCPKCRRRLLALNQLDALDGPGFI